MTVIDYRKLNAITTDDPYQMPRVEDMLERLGQAQYLSTLDLAKGYYQVPVTTIDRDKTAFLSPYGKNTYRTMPFGLRVHPPLSKDSWMECWMVYKPSPLPIWTI